MGYISLFSQAFPDRHSTNLSDSWLSCQTTANPKTEQKKTEEPKKEAEIEPARKNQFI